MPSIWDYLQGAPQAPPAQFPNPNAPTSALTPANIVPEMNPAPLQYLGHLAQPFINRMFGPQSPGSQMQVAYQSGYIPTTEQQVPWAVSQALASTTRGTPFSRPSALGSAGGRMIQPTIEEAPARGLLTRGEPEAIAGGRLDKPIKDFTPADWGAYGKQYGVPNLGPSSNAAFEKSLAPIKTESGREVTIPGGIADETKPFSYYDLLHLKAQGINPNDLKPEVHRAIHNRMVTTMQPDQPLTDPRVFNQLSMGMISPNNPLTPNEFAVARVMAKSPEDISRIGDMVPWKAGDTTYQGKPITPAMRQEVSGKIANALGIQAGSAGGLGVRGSADYTRVAEMAQMMKDKPEFFRFGGEGEGGASPSENWARFVSRLASQVPGLSAKTGSFAGVWQAPREAAISAIDRHMAGKLESNIFENPEERASWTKDTLAAFNKDRPADKQASTIGDMIEGGGKGQYVDRILAYVNAHPERMLRTRQGGINPNVPAWMGNVDWVREPQKVTWASDPYVRALEANQQLAQQDQQGLFSSQWMHWDRIRNRLEPHEIMFPGLEKLPRMDLPQTRDALQAHNAAGYLAGGGAEVTPVRPVKNPSSLGYFSLPLMLGAGATAAPMLAPRDQQ